MTQSADQPLLTAPPASVEPKNPKRPRAAAGKSRSAAASEPAPEAGSNGEAPAKPKAVRRSSKAVHGAELPGLEAVRVPEPAKKTPKRAAAKVTDSENGETAAPKAKRAPRASKPRTDSAPAPAAERETPIAAPAPAPVAQIPVSDPAPAPRPAPPVEEWSPTRPAAPTPAPAAAPAANEAAAGAETSAAPARKYPVYIPRHVAKQMEEQGQTAPLAVPADAIPEAARAAVEAARAAHQAQAAPVARPEPAPHGPPPAQSHGQPYHREHDRDGGRDRGGRGRDHRGRDRHRDRDRDRDVEREQDPERDYVGGEAPLEGEVVLGEGIVEISGKGFGFIRDPKRSFAQHPQDIFVTPEIVRKYHLRDGQWIKGETRRGGRGAQLCKLLSVNGDDPEGARILPAFDELTVVSPMERITLETTPERNTTRFIDLFSPIGKGQRGIIVAPPRTGKTTFLQHIADAVVKNHPDIVLIILLVDERPEEVTDIKRTVPSAEIMASSNDMDVKSHTRIAQLAIERAKRLVESGKDVFVLLDSITRVGRAFNNAMASGGRTMSGGVDARALEIPRRLFAAARNTEEAGSLTIVATALIETGSKADELIFQEFKGTGNMELVLDRKISEQRIYPAIDIFQSGTRREELLIPADDLHKIAIIRRGLAGHKPMEAIERLLYFLRKFPTNAQMLREIPG